MKIGWKGMVIQMTDDEREFYEEQLKALEEKERYNEIIEDCMLNGKSCDFGICDECHYRSF